MQNKLTHIDHLNQPKMVDVTPKKTVMRLATAEGHIHLSQEARQQIAQNRIKKGNVCLTAELAGVMAAKKTPELIPLCHHLLLTGVDVRAQLTDDGVHVEATVKCVGQTGVEMEALTAVSTALLTVYDMCKAVDKQMRIDGVRLVQKTKTELCEEH